jgi:hypothetical protein
MELLGIAFIVYQPDTLFHDLMEYPIGAGIEIKTQVFHLWLGRPGTAVDTGYRLDYIVGRPAPGDTVVLGRTEGLWPALLYPYRMITSFPFFVPETILGTLLDDSVYIFFDPDKGEMDTTQ